MKEPTIEQQEVEKRRIRICQRVQKYLEEPGKSQNQLADAINMGRSTLSQIMKKTYPGDPSNQLDKIECWLGQENESITLNLKTNFVMTAQAQAIIQAVKQAHIFKRIFFISSSSGLGKTTTLEHYTRHTPNVYLITGTDWIQSRGAFLEELCDAIGVPFSTNYNRSYKKLTATAAQAGACFIIDDMQELMNVEGRIKTAIFKGLRTLSDKGIGVVIAGNPDIVIDAAKNHSGSFHQQLMCRASLLTLSEWVSEDDFKALIASLFDGMLKKEEFIYLYTVVNGFFGGIRVALDILTMSVVQARAQHSKLSLALLKRTAGTIPAVRKPNAKGKTNEFTIIEEKNEKEGKIGINQKTGDNGQIGQARIIHQGKISRTDIGAVAQCG